jgi:hypothetical protein
MSIVFGWPDRGGNKANNNPKVVEHVLKEALARGSTTLLSELVRNNYGEKDKFTFRMSLN